MVFCLTGSMEPPARGWGSGGSSLGWAPGRDRGRGRSFARRGEGPPSGAGMCAQGASHLEGPR